MINYSYFCLTCGATWHAEQRMSEDPHTICPECGETTSKGRDGIVVAGPRRNVEARGDGATGFILRGENWAGKEAKKAAQKARTG